MLPYCMGDPNLDLNFAILIPHSTNERPIQDSKAEAIGFLVKSVVVNELASILYPKPDSKASG